MIHANDKNLDFLKSERQSRWVEGRLSVGMIVYWGVGIHSSVFTQLAMEKGDCEEVLETTLREDPTSDRVLKLFIELYETLPELWNCASPHYANKYRRNEALVKLREVYKEIKPNASLSDVRKKINTLRSNFRRELNKIKASKRTGAGADEVYTPSSWVFYSLSFLHETESPATLVNDTQADESQEPHAAEQNISMESCRESQRGPTTSLSSLTPKQPPPKKRKKLGPIARQNELLKLACDFLNKGANDSKESGDEYQDIAKVWANKLKALDTLQRRLAERAINEVLFEAELGTLHRNSVQINQGTLSDLTSPSTSNHSSAHGTNVHTPLLLLSSETRSPHYSEQSSITENVNSFYCNYGNI